MVFKAVGEGRNRKLCVPQSALEHTSVMTFMTTATIRQTRTKVVETENRRVRLAKESQNVKLRYSHLLG